jgi:hypothetical protein
MAGLNGEDHHGSKLKALLPVGPCRARVRGHGGWRALAFGWGWGLEEMRETSFV